MFYFYKSKICCLLGKGRGDLKETHICSEKIDGDREAYDRGIGDETRSGRERSGNLGKATVCKM